MAAPGPRSAASQEVMDWTKQTPVIKDIQLQLFHLSKKIKVVFTCFELLSLSLVFSVKWIFSMICRHQGEK